MSVSGVFSMIGWYFANFSAVNDAIGKSADAAKAWYDLLENHTTQEQQIAAGTSQMTTDQLNQQSYQQAEDFLKQYGPTHGE